MTVLSAAIRRLRREGLEIRRKRAALAPTGGGVAKKPSSPPPPCPPPTPVTPRSADGDDTWLERAPPPPSAASSLSRHAESIGNGAQVRVRTRTGTAPTGQPIVFWLRAAVDSTADEDGYHHVTYSYIDGKLPRVARVAPSDIRVDDVPPDDDRDTAASTGSPSAVTTDRSARRSQQNRAAPRPTVAGKKLPLLKKFEKEMESRSKAIIGCW